MSKVTASGIISGNISTQRIKLNNGQEIPQVALGVYKAPNDGSTENACKWAFDAGYRHIDSGKFSCASFSIFGFPCDGDVLLRPNPARASPRAMYELTDSLCTPCVSFPCFSFCSCSLHERGVGRSRSCRMDQGEQRAPFRNLYHLQALGR